MRKSKLAAAQFVGGLASLGAAFALGHAACACVPSCGAAARVLSALTLAAVFGACLLLVAASNRLTDTGS